MGPWRSTVPSTGFCSRPRAGRSQTKRSRARSSSPARPTQACTCSRSRACTGSRSGSPAPGLLPTKREWAEQREIVSKAVKRLKRKGIDADGHVLGTRNATKRILQEAKREGCDVIVMAADPDRNRFIGNMSWEQEPQRVQRRSKLPVVLVREAP